MGKIAAAALLATFKLKFVNCFDFLFFFLCRPNRHLASIKSISGSFLVYHMAQYSISVFCMALVDQSKNYASPRLVSRGKTNRQDVLEDHAPSFSGNKYCKTALYKSES